MTYWPWLTTLAPVFTNFSRSVMSDQCSISYGKAEWRLGSIPAVTVHANYVDIAPLPDIDACKSVFGKNWARQN